jgi:hypothetical protein
MAGGIVRISLPDKEVLNALHITSDGQQDSVGTYDIEIQQKSLGEKKNCPDLHSGIGQTLIEIAEAAERRRRKSW